MSTYSRIPTVEEFCEILLARRAEAVEELEQARASGNRRETAAWQSLIKRADKLLSRYGLAPTESGATTTWRK